MIKRECFIYKENTCKTKKSPIHLADFDKTMMSKQEATLNIDREKVKYVQGTLSTHTYMQCTCILMQITRFHFLLHHSCLSFPVLTPAETTRRA